MNGAHDLCSDKYGHHVFQTLLEHDKCQHRRRVVQVLVSDPCGFAKKKHSSYMVEWMLRNGAAEDQEEQLLLAHLSRAEVIADLALDRYGRYVAKTLLQDPRVNVEAAKQMIWSQRLHFQETTHGQQLLADLGMALLDGDKSTCVSQGHVC